MPSPNNTSKKPLSDAQQGSIAAAFIAAACLVAAPLAVKWEGYQARTYKDPAGIPTYCYGETENISRDPSRVYAQSECLTLLRSRMARDYAPKILKCLPQLGQPERRHVFGALIDASYNAGPVAVCKSPMAIHIRAGRWISACSAMPTWYVTATKRVNGKRVGKPFFLRGLVNRRNDEKKLCLTPVVG